MLDINFIRENPEIVKKAITDKLMKVDLDRLLELDGQIRECIKEVDSLRSERNALSKRIPALDRVTKNDAVAKVKAIKEKLSDLEESLSEMKLEFNDLMFKVPSIPATEVPIGKDETDNVEIRRWGVSAAV